MKRGIGRMKELLAQPFLKTGGPVAANQHRFFYGRPELQLKAAAEIAMDLVNALHRNNIRPIDSVKIGGIEYLLEFINPVMYYKTAF